MFGKNFWEICRMAISSPKERFSDRGKVLKSAWMLGPSKAVLSKGKTEDIKTDNTDNDTSSKSDKEASDKDIQDKNKSSSEDDVEFSNKKDNEEFTHSYSILEAFSNISLLYEFDDPGGKYTGANSIDASDSSGNNDTSDNSESSDENPRKNEPENKEGKSKDKTKEKDNPDKENQLKETFKGNYTYKFNIGIENEGYTQWVVAIDERADINAVESAIRAKKFKQAYQIASLNLDSDGLVPLSATTYIVKELDVPPPFIGHCRYGFDSGSVDETSEEDLTVCLAVAPINAKTKKPDEDTVIKAVYNVTGDITGGVIGDLAATAVKKIRDFALDTKDRYYGRDDDDDKDSEKSKSDALHKFLQKAFRCVGDHTMYDNFLSIRKFIHKHIEEKNLELQSISVGNKGSSVQINNELSKTIFKNQLIYF